MATPVKTNKDPLRIDFPFKMVAFHMFFFTHWHRHWTMCPQSSAQPLRPFHRRFRWERVFRSPHGTALGFFSQPKKLPATTPCNVVSWRKYVFFHNLFSQWIVCIFWLFLMFVCLFGDIRVPFCFCVFCQGFTKSWKCFFYNFWKCTTYVCCTTAQVTSFSIQIISCELIYIAWFNPSNDECCR